MSEYYEQILNEAHGAATKAIRDLFDDGYVEPEFDSGFAWVVIDGRNPLVRYAKTKLKRLDSANWRGDTRRYGSPHYPKGWSFWGPGDWPTKEQVGVTVYGQSMTFKRAASKKFAEVLESYGIPASVGSRLD